VGKVNTALRARLTDALASAEGRSDARLVDIRSADEYQGKVFAPAGVPELAIRAGHIPGAVNVPWGQAVREDGSFKSAEELKKLYAGVGRIHNEAGAAFTINTASNAGPVVQTGSRPSSVVLGISHAF